MPLTSYVSNASKIDVKISSIITDSFTDLDSHSDTCVVGRNALVIDDYDRTVSVSGFHQSLGTMNDRRIVSAAIAYIRPENGEMIILIVNQAILIEDLEHNLLCPMQLRLAGVQVNDRPKCMTHQPTEEDHAITVKDEDDDRTIIIPLGLRGVTSYFNSRRPTKAQWEDDTITKVAITAEAPEWDPHTEEFSQLESNYFDSSDCFREIGEDRRRVYSTHVSEQISQQNAENIAEKTSQSTAVLTEIDSNLLQDEFARNLRDNAIITDHDVRRISSASANKDTAKLATSSSTRKQGIQPEDLVQRWKCSIENAKQTLKVTTQRGVRTVANPAISRRFRTNDRQLRYRRLRADIFTDTLKAKTVSFRKNKYAQAYGTSFKWARCYGMQSKSDAHYTLNSMFARDGVPNNMFCDNAMEQIGGQFRKSCQDSGCRLKSSEPHTPWSNAAEGTIRELKQGSACKMQVKGCPKRFWDDYIEMESYIMSHTAYPLWDLKGEVPETVMTGNTADVSQFDELGWYD